MSLFANATTHRFRSSSRPPESCHILLHRTGSLLSRAPSHVLSPLLDLSPARPLRIHQTNSTHLNDNLFLIFSPTRLILLLSFPSAPLTTSTLLTYDGVLFVDAPGLGAYPAEGIDEGLSELEGMWWTGISGTSGRASRPR
jgi:hypothetical protein